MSDIIDFYKGKKSINDGDFFHDIIYSSYDKLETDHAWVQWVFPSDELSNFNTDAPILTEDDILAFKNDIELQNQVILAFKLFLMFLQFKMVGLVICPTIELPWWLSGFNHNMLRVTRVLKCLRLVGLSVYADAFYEALRPFEDKVGANTWEFWTNAIKD